MQGTDQTILQTLGDRLSRQRLERGFTQAALAEEAGVSKRTVERMEAGASTQLTNAVRVLRVLGLLGGLDQLVPEVPASPMAALRAERGRRKRARGRAMSVRETRTAKQPYAAGPATPAQPNANWTWGDDT